MVKSAKKIVSSRAFLCEYWTTEEKAEKRNTQITLNYINLITNLCRKSLN